MKNKLFGFGIVQVLVGVALLGVLAVAFMELSETMNIQGKRGKESAVLVSMRNVAVPISKDIVRWIGLMRASYPILSACIPEVSSASHQCPVPSATHSDALAEIQKKIWYCDRCPA